MSFIKKFITSLIAGLSTVSLILVFGNSGSISWLPPIFIFSLSGLILLVSFIIPLIWHYRFNEVSRIKTEEILNQITIYSLSCNIATFGWKKIMGLQFIVPDEISSKPINELSGEWLTWYYFGYSHSFGYILAFIQIVGSYLLLNSKTTLLSSIILFAFMANLTLINIFYQMNFGALLQSVIIFISLIYLIGLNYKKLLIILKLSNLPNGIKNLTLKNPFAIITIILGIAFVYYLKSLAS